ncbi:isocitrate lyase/PEP mutase family protein [Algihabitans albus]|uniref:isocitrate lyase/PEP mutase family protein n=1 Tax=Algihabitans albus TaxID=2164067 RepID=UPI000E5CBE58|nr:isocitrate lyase/PEP mutase family protein [Algihabitans albus]
MTRLDKTTFAAKARAGETIWTAGAFDALSAKLAEEAGFAAIMSTGFGVSASHLGAPDVELYTMTENLAVVRNMVNAVTVPLVADTDTGYGNAINVMRTVREFEQAGVAAMILEDQEVPKRCPAVANSVEILPIDEGSAKIRAAAEARRDPDSVIIARTDAFNEADGINRARAYVAAGADLIQPISRGFTDFDALRRLRDACGVPLSLQILGWLETDLTRDQIEQVAGLAVFPLVSLMTATAAMRANLQALSGAHSTRELPRQTTSLKDFKSFIGFDEVERQKAKFLVRELPEALSTVDEGAR